MRFSFAAAPFDAVQTDIPVCDRGIRDHRPALDPVKRPALSVKIIEKSSMTMTIVKVRSD
jgi:hypothetical protein